jgi:hypothetical protein
MEYRIGRRDGGVSRSGRGPLISSIPTGRRPHGRLRRGRSERSRMEGGRCGGPGDPADPSTTAPRWAWASSRSTAMTSSSSPPTRRRPTCSACPRSSCKVDMSARLASRARCWRTGSDTIARAGAWGGRSDSNTTSNGVANGGGPPRPSPRSPGAGRAGNDSPSSSRRSPSGSGRRRPSPVTPCCWQTCRIPSSSPTWKASLLTGMRGPPGSSAGGRRRSSGGHRRRRCPSRRAHGRSR